MRFNKNFLLGAIGIIITIASFIWLYFNIDLESIKQHLSSINVLFPLAACILYYLTFYTRSIRWKLILGNPDNLPFSLYTKSLFIGFTGNNILPARIGEIIRSEHFCYHSKINRVSVITSLVAEKILDSIIMLSILIIIALFSNYSSQYQNKVNNIILAGTIFTGVLITILLSIRLYGKRLSLFISKKSPKLAGYILQIQNSLSFVAPNFSFLKILFFGTLSWLMEGLMFVLITYALAPESHYWLAGLICIGIVNFSIVLPSSPGYLGVFQAATVLALSLYDIDSSLAFVIGFVVNMCMIISSTPFGILYGFKESLSLLTSSSKKRLAKV